MNRHRAAARLMILRRLLDRQEIGSQDELVKQLGKRGHRVTQATVSRDLANLGVQKVPGSDGRERYVIVADTEGRSEALRNLGHRMREFVSEIGHSANLVVLKTGPGSASPVAAALDAAGLDGILGTIGGDDTILVITRDASGGAAVAQKLEDILEARDG